MITSIRLFHYALLSVVLLPACSRPTAQSAAPSTPPNRELVNFTTSVATEQPMPRYLRVTGELKGARQAMLAPDAPGKVVDAPIERGSAVAAGDVILKLDDRAATLTLREAEASRADAQLKLDWAHAEFTRNETLSKQRLIAASEFEQFKLNRATADTALAAATARRDSAKKALDDTVLRAPFGGAVVERLTEVGEFVNTSTGVARLVATENLRLVVLVPEVAVGGIHAGQAVSFTVPAFADETFVGTVKFIGAALRESSRDLAIEAEVRNASGKLKPGMFAEGRITLTEVKCLTVPATALRVDGGTHKVFVIRGGLMDERVVEVGETRGEAVEIRRGLVEGDAVLIHPGTEATDGAKVALAARL